MPTGPFTIDNEATTETVKWASHETSEPFATDRPPLELVRRLGANPEGDLVHFGFWVPPELSSPALGIELELFEPPEDLDLTTPIQVIDLPRATLPMASTGEFSWVTVRGVTVGDRNRIGTLYRVVVQLPGDRTVTIDDPLAISTPLGAFAPAEVIDSTSISTDRADSKYYRTLASDDGTPEKVPPCVNLMQVHVPTATESGTLAGLKRWIDEVAAKVSKGERLDPRDEVWLDYDGIELLPVEPTIGFEAGPPSWEPIAESADSCTVRMRRPATTDWGYDIIISGGAAVNPTLLDGGRPHELADLAAALHQFPGSPMRLIVDVVYGHADNQAVGVVPRAWFTGPDMYGQHLDYRNPIVRAHLLEMQRRKVNFGVDGVRVDGAQDFTWWNEESERLEYHDGFMEEMSAVVQEVDGVRYRPWMVFEDGRPWPKEDWELSSTYRAVIERQPDVHQWGPLTFAHNTPFLFTFWVTKWWRLREIAEVGSTWINGCANHDTLRRGSQVDPEARINHYLGETLPDVIRNAYDHAAANLLFHAFLPGTPMDFLQASVRAPWSFIRNTDHRFALKVWAEEKRFLDWRVTADDYRKEGAFARLKALGFVERDSLYRLMTELEAAVNLHGDRLDAAVEAARRVVLPPGFTADADHLRAAARAWMDDVHEFCVATRHLEQLDPDRVRFNRDVRAFRRRHRWLTGDLAHDDIFDYLHPTNGSVVFHGLRSGPNDVRVLLIANMEGQRTEIVPEDLPGASGGTWTPELVAPGVQIPQPGAPLVLHDACGVVYVDRS